MDLEMPGTSNSNNEYQDASNLCGDELLGKRHQKQTQHFSRCDDGNVMLDEPIDVDYNPCISESSEHFRKESSMTLNDMTQSLSATMNKCFKVGFIGQAKICPVNGKVKLTKAAGKIKRRFGFSSGGDHYMNPEEALYLLECGKMEIFIGDVNLSVERARSLLLHSDLSFPNKNGEIVTCHIDEYQVYKHLTKHGYWLKRVNRLGSKPSQCSKQFNNKCDEAVEMEDDNPAALGYLKVQGNHQGNEEKIEISGSDGDDDIQILKSSFNKGRKRKFESAETESVYSEATEADSMLEEEEQEDIEMEVDSEELSAECSHLMYNNIFYTVQEADSDSEVEIVDTVIHNHNGVWIQEIGGDSDNINANSFKNNELVEVSSASSSDSENEECDAKKLWSKFIPGLVVHVGFPPPTLLPPNIPHRNKIYEFKLSSQKDNANIDIENFVDDLAISSDVTGSSDKTIRKEKCRTWSQWRQAALNEAKKVMEKSLLSENRNKECDELDTFRRLHLWDTDSNHISQQAITTEAERDWRSRIIYDVFSPNPKLSSKPKKPGDLSPICKVVVVRNSESIQDLSNWCPEEIETDIVFAIVSDENDVIFLSAGSPEINNVIWN